MRNVIIVSLLIVLMSCESNYREQTFSVVKDSLEFSIKDIDRTDSIILANSDNVLRFDTYVIACIKNIGKSSVEYLSRDSNLTNMTIEYHTVNKGRWTKNLYSDYSSNYKIYNIGNNQQFCSPFFFPKENVDTLILNFNYKKHPENTYSNNTKIFLCIKENRINSIW